MLGCFWSGWLMLGGGRGDLRYLPRRSIMGRPALRKRMLRAVSFALISSHISSTARIKLTSAAMNTYSPAGLSALHSAAMRSPAAWERPTK